MSLGRLAGHLAQQPPARAAAMFIACLALGIAACDKKSATPAWDSPGIAQQVSAAQSAPATPEPQPAPTADTPRPETPAADATSSGGLRFIAYNVENWLTMDRFVNQKALKNSPKPEKEREAAIRILAHHTPDVVGLCEIGESRDLAEIQQSLKAAGLDLPHSHFDGGSDPVRHLGLLSRYPITSTARATEMEYRMKGQTFAINRGILDSTIQARGKSYRFLGVHLKSKRELEDADQEDMRIHEARLLRRHVDAILKTAADTRLVVYGDFNDTRPSKAFKAVTGSYNDPGYLTAIPFKDSRGDAWTHYWSLHDIYSRFDFVTVSRALKPEVDFRASRILDDTTWNDASDHRPLLAIFR